MRSDETSKTWFLMNFMFLVPLSQLKCLLHQISLTSFLPALFHCITVSQTFPLYPQVKKIHLKNGICKAYADFQHYDPVITNTSDNDVVFFASFIPNYLQATLKFCNFSAQLRSLWTIKHHSKSVLKGTWCLYTPERAQK